MSGLTTTVGPSSISAGSWYPIDFPLPKPLPTPDADSQAYWQGLKDGKLLLQHCGQCGHVQFYQQVHCRQCGSEQLTHRAEHHDRRRLVERRVRAIVVEYEVLAPLVDPALAVDGSFPPIHPEGNVIRHQRIVHGDVRVSAGVRRGGAAAEPGRAAQKHQRHAGSAESTV